MIFPSSSGKIIYPVMIAGLMLIAGAIAVLAYSLWSEREQTKASAERNTQNLAQVIEAQTSHAFRAVDITLVGLNDALKLVDATGADRDSHIHALLRQRLQSLQFVGAIFILDKNGIQIHDSGALPAKRADLSDRLYFTVQRDDSDHGLYISSPISSPLISRTAGHSITR